MMSMNGNRQGRYQSLRSRTAQHANTDLQHWVLISVYHDGDVEQATISIPPTTLFHWNFDLKKALTSIVFSMSKALIDPEGGWRWRIEDMEWTAHYLQKLTPRRGVTG